jgi:hypothetical protein
MIVFIDQPKREVKLYSEKGIEVYELEEVDELVTKIGKKKVLYVYQAMEVTGAQISETVNGLIAATAGQRSELDELDSQTYYLQSQIKGVLHIQDINVTFDGFGDCKQIDEEMAGLIQESSVLRRLLKDQKVKIVDYGTMRRASKQQAKNREKFQKVRQASKDRELDSIIVKTDRPGSAEMLASGMFEDGDVETTDITDSIINDPTEGMSPDELDAALKSGKFAP